MRKDLARWIRGMPLIPPHAVALPHQPGRIQLIAAFTAVMVVEIIVVDLLLPWTWLRILVAVISAYSIIMLWCFIADEKQDALPQK
ncbi:hypothetical protein [Corynebacterium cystitidis]|uniref:hypothetical protein n=1 Tax=Corynebacterium cystitidis TaxID=35757 RepID=UPI00211F114D|nr:hypothetical protein [Corynebacterium cystitidis]